MTTWGLSPIRGLIIPFFHPPLSEVWLLPKDTTDTISTATWDLPITKAILGYVSTVFSPKLTPKHNCNPRRPDRFSPPLVAKTNPCLCPLLTTWSSIPTAAIQLSCPKLPQHCSIPDILCLAAKSLLSLFFILAVGKTPWPLLSYGHLCLQPSPASLLPSALQRVSTSSWSPLDLTPFPPYCLLLSFPMPLDCSPRFTSKLRVWIPVWNFKTTSTGLWDAQPGLSHTHFHMFPHDRSRIKPKALSGIRPTNTLSKRGTAVSHTLHIALEFFKVIKELHTDLPQHDSPLRLAGQDYLCGTRRAKIWTSK